MIKVFELSMQGIEGGLEGMVFQVTDLSIGEVYQPFQRFPVFFPSKVPTVTVLVSRF